MAGEKDDKEEFQFYNLPKRTPWESFWTFVWNSDDRQFLGRTGLSWAKITIFYVLFYIGLAIFITICYSMFLLTLSHKYPKWQQDSSLIGSSPGLGFRPLTLNSLIWYKETNQSTYKPWVDNLMQFLDDYYAPRKYAKGNGKQKACSYSNYPIGDEVCDVDVRDWGPCGRNDIFNYNTNSPCIFLKLNRIYGWTPDYYLHDNELPQDMPKDLKDRIRSIKGEINRKNVWLSCVGEKEIDKQMMGKVTYYPKDIQGFPGFYFPYLNKAGYLSPLVAVKLENPVRGVIMNIECRAWAKNIKYNRADKLGSVHLELLIDK